jgi:hypothetical protein
MLVVANVKITIMRTRPTPLTTIFVPFAKRLPEQKGFSSLLFETLREREATPTRRFALA